MRPLVVIKPSGAICLDGNPFHIPREMFAACSTTVGEFILMLNEHNPNVPLGHESVDKRWSSDMCLRMFESVTLQKVLELSEYYQCNVLGGVFLAFISAYGITPLDHVGLASVNSDDKDFMIGFYPDLIPYYEDSEGIDIDQNSFAQSIIHNNTGHFLALRVRGAFKDTLQKELMVLAYLKRVYRYYIRFAIPWNTPVRDNVIHTPWTYTELEAHYGLLQERFV